MQVLRNKTKLLHSFNFFSLLLISVIIISGLFLRVYNLSSQSYWMDEGYTINAVLSIKENNSTLLDSGNYYSCFTYCYPTYYFTTLFGDNSFSYRLLSVISGVLLILILYIIIKKEINFKVAILTSFFTAFSYYEIAWSREARWYTLFSLFFFLSSYFFYKADKTRKNLYYFYSIIFTIFSILTHSISLLLPISFLIYKFFKNFELLNIKNNILHILLLLILSILSLFFVEYIFNINLLINAMKNISFNINIDDYIEFYFKNYSLFITLLLFSFFMKTKEEYKNYYYFSIIIITTYLIPLSFFTEVINYRYFFQLVPFLFLIASMTIDNIISGIKSIKNKIILLLTFLSLFFLTGTGVIFPVKFYFLESDLPSQSWFKKDYYSYTPQPNWNEAYSVIMSNKKETDLIISNEPQFNKIFLNEAGYYLSYDRSGIDEKNKITIKDDREFYVNAISIHDLDSLKKIINEKHGYIVFDYLFVDKLNNLDKINYIKEHAKLIFFDEINEVSKIWVFSF